MTPAAGPRLLPVGSTAVLVEVSGTAEALDLAAHLRASGLRCDDVVPAATTVLVDGIRGVDDVRTALEEWVPGESPEDDGPVVELPTAYDGADLADVAARWGVDVDDVVERHAAIVFTAAFAGFAPGFAYLAGLPSELALPRLDSPRPRVPAGSVGLADAWCGVYPTASPGGWRLLGRTDALLWDPSREAPALLAPGTRVRFVPR